MADKNETKIDEDKERLPNKAKYKAQQKLPLSRSVSDRRYTQNSQGEKHKLNV